MAIINRVRILLGIYVNLIYLCTERARAIYGGQSSNVDYRPRLCIHEKLLSTFLGTLKNTGKPTVVINVLVDFLILQIHSLRIHMVVIPLFDIFEIRIFISLFLKDHPNRVLDHPKGF